MRNSCLYSQVFVIIYLLQKFCYQLSSVLLKFISASYFNNTYNWRERVHVAFLLNAIKSG